MFVGGVRSGPSDVAILNQNLLVPLIEVFLVVELVLCVCCVRACLPSHASATCFRGQSCGLLFSSTRCHMGKGSWPAG